MSSMHNLSQIVPSDDFDQSPFVFRCYVFIHVSSIASGDRTCGIRSRVTSLLRAQRALLRAIPYRDTARPELGNLLPAPGQAC